MEEVQKIFDEADEDKSGGLSLEEFKKVIKKMNEEITKQRNKLPEEMAESIFDFLADGGELTTEKLSDFLNDKMDEKEMMRSMIRKADKDGDGFIDMEELQKFAMFLNRGNEKRANDFAKLIMKVCGAPKAKKLEPNAVMEFFKVGEDKPKDPKEKAKAIFKMYDTNGDGYLDNKELLEYTTRFMEDDDDLKNDPMTAQVVKMMIAKHDEDEDGKMNFEEFCNYLDKKSDCQ